MIRSRIAALGATVALALLTAALLVATLPVQAAAASPSSSAGPSFGAILDWRSDTAQHFAERLGGTPQIYGKKIGYPLGKADSDELAALAHAAAAQGSSVLIDLEPRAPLAALTSGQAADLAQQLATLGSALDTRFLVDFAPEMNGSWQAWGQQPKSYVAAFRVIAAAVHHATTRASMVWEPANGAGYPFGASRGKVRPSGPRVTAQLDTNGDGRVTETDDPYGVYWPGRSYVDQVALSVFWYGGTRHLGTNTLPPVNWYRDSLAGTVGYSTAKGTGRDFVARFSVAQDKPMFVVTGALTVAPTGAGPTPAGIAAAWIHQVFAPATLAAFPSIDGVVWLEQRSAEVEAQGRLVDWRVTASPSTAHVLRTALTGAHVRLGPVPASAGRQQANAAAAQLAVAPGGQGDRILAGIAVLTALFLLAGLASRLRPTWRYPSASAGGGPADAGRDGRIDLLRGFVMAAVIITHVGLAGPWSWFVNRAGALAGAEVFVLLSGIVLGALYTRMVTVMGAYASAVVMVQRAGKLYAKTVAVILAVFFIAKIPWVNANSVTTFTDRGTGAGGEQAAGRVYYLYGSAQHLLDYPTPAYAIKDLLLLRYGPWPMNIMGLFVLLSLAVPPAMWLVRRGLWWLLLAISWGLYALNLVHPVQLFDAQFEAVFPLFAWQLAFTHGLVIGRYRDRIVAALSTRTAKVILTVGLLAYLAGLLALRAGVQIAGVPKYSALYESWYLRTNLDGGRLFDVAVFLITAYAFLTACWRPAHATIGRLFEPLGRASLTVFLIQVFLVLAVGNIPHLDQHSAWQGFVVQTVGVAAIWAIVRYRPWRRLRQVEPPTPQPAAANPEPQLVG